MFTSQTSIFKEYIKKLKKSNDTLLFNYCKKSRKIEGKRVKPISRTK